MGIERLLVDQRAILEISSEVRVAVEIIVCWITVEVVDGCLKALTVGIHCVHQDIRIGRVTIGSEIVEEGVGDVCPRVSACCVLNRSLGGVVWKEHIGSCVVLPRELVGGVSKVRPYP